MTARKWFALFAVYITWGSTYLAIRFAVQSIPPFLMAGTRFLIAGAILYIWQRAVGASRPRPLEWRSAAIVGLLMLMGANGAVSWAEQRVVSGIAALLVGSAPLWMALIDALRPGGRRPTWLTAAGLLVGFSGIVILVGPSSLLPGPAHSLDLLGVAALLLAGFLWATGSLYNRGACLPESPLLGTGMEMLAGGAGLFVLGTALGEWGRLDLNAVSTESLLGLGYLVVFGSLVGLSAYTWLLRVAPTPLVSTYAYVNPLIAIFMGNLLAQEPLTPQILAAAAIIVSAVAIINFDRRRAHKPVVDYSATPCED